MSLEQDTCRRENKMSQEMRKLMDAVTSDVLNENVDVLSLSDSYQDLLMDIATEYISWKHDGIGFDLYNEDYLDYYEDIRQAIANLGLSEPTVRKIYFSHDGFQKFETIMKKLGSHPTPGIGFADRSPQERDQEEYLQLINPDDDY